MEEKLLLLKILKEIDELKILIPHELSVSEIANLTGKPANTIRRYVIANFEPEVEYKKKGGKIYVYSNSVLRIRRYYAKKR